MLVHVKALYNTIEIRNSSKTLDNIMAPVKIIHISITEINEWFFVVFLQQIKVAEHSFSARFCWCKLARAQGFQKTNMPPTEQSFYLLNTCTICVIFLYICMQCIDGSSILLQRYVTKGNDAKNPPFLAFVCYRENPVKCNACAVARKTETDCFSRNVPFSRDPVVRISRNLAKK